MGYHIHLKLREREDIMMVRRDGRGVSEVARAIARGKSTVLRELSAQLMRAVLPQIDGISSLRRAADCVSQARDTQR